MIIAEKKIVTLTESERMTLQDAEELLDALAEALGNDDHFDFNEISETLYYIRHTDKFEVDYTQE